MRADQGAIWLMQNMQCVTQGVTAMVNKCQCQLAINCALKSSLVNTLRAKQFKELLSNTGAGICPRFHPLA